MRCFKPEHEDEEEEEPNNGALAWAHESSALDAELRMLITAIMHTAIMSNGAFEAIPSGNSLLFLEVGHPHVFGCRLDVRTHPAFRCFNLRSRILSASSRSALHLVSFWRHDVIPVSASRFRRSQGRDFSGSGSGMRLRFGPIQDADLSDGDAALFTRAELILGLPFPQDPL